MSYSDQELVSRFLSRTSHLSVYQAGNIVDVSHETVARWRRGDWSRLYWDTRQKLTRKVEEWTSEEPESDPLHVFWDSARIEALIRRIAPPGEGRAAKLQALDGYRDLVSPIRAIGPWWAELKSRVETEEL